MLPFDKVRLPEESFWYAVVTFPWQALVLSALSLHITMINDCFVWKDHSNTPLYPTILSNVGALSPGHGRVQLMLHTLRTCYWMLQAHQLPSISPLSEETHRIANGVGGLSFWSIIAMKCC